MKVPVNRILLCKNESKSTHYNCILRVITVRNSSCGKVMFSQVSVCPQGGVQPPSLWTDTPPPPPSDGRCSGRYASYWSAFLFSKCLFHMQIKIQTTCDLCPIRTGNLRCTSLDSQLSGQGQSHEVYRGYQVHVIT